MNTQKASRPCRRHSRCSKAARPALALALAVRLLHPQRLSADGHLDLKQEWYDEDHHRMHVDTSSAEGEFHLGSSTIARSTFIYDSISGASPTGLPPPAGSDQVPVKELRDIRRGVEAELEQRWGLNTLRPSFAYSIESDYESYGVGYTHSVDLNQKNTKLSLGLAGSFDRIFPKQFFGMDEHKKSGDLLVGLTQLLGPKTILTANISAGLAHGYLADPYKGIQATYYPDPNRAFPEQRPRERTKEMGFFSLLQYVTPLRGSAEVEYRIYHDSFGVLSHTAALQWHQKLGKHVLLEPMVRYMKQSAADFYMTVVPGDPSCPIDNPICPDIVVPTYYSADYRLSSMHTWTYGMKASFIVKSYFSLDVTYHRYTMHGDDHVTSQSAYPSANIVTGGLTVWF